MRVSFDRRRRRARPIRRLLVVLLLGLAWLVPTSSAQAARSAQAAPKVLQPTCSLAEGTTHHIGMGGLRYYRLHIPAGLTGPRMVVLSLHGGVIHNAGAWEEASRWNDYAAAAGFIVAYPQGSLINTWEPNAPSSPDIPFLLDVVADISAKCSVDTDNVHIQGVSMGGWMAQRMLCHSPHIFATASAGGAGHPEDDHWLPIQDPPYECEPSRPVSVLLAKGSEEGGSAGENARDQWVADNNCPTPPDQVAMPAPAVGTADIYSPCDAGTTVVWRVIDGFGHEVPPPEVTDQLLDEQYQFFVENPLP